MNINGFTNDNLHIGDVRITGDLQVDGALEVDEIKVNELKIDGYTLPTSAGTDGQVITMNADGKTTDFKDAGGGITGYFYRNLFTMAEANTNFTANPAVINNLYTSGTGNLDLGSIDNYPINSTIKWYVRGRLDLTSNAGIVNADGRFQLTINENVVAPASPINYFTDISSLSTGGTQPNSMFAIDICITRIAANSYRFNGYGQFSSGSTGTLTMDWNDVILTPPVPYTTWEMKLGYYYLGVNVARPITETLTCDLIVDTSALIAAPPAPTSHTALTDLTLGDAGHSQFALLQGRSGGQILSGGITPLHDLKLKSHTAGLDNIIVRDLKTEFKKNIDMDNKNIENANEIIKNNPSGADLRLENKDGPVVISAQGVLSNIQLTTPNNMILTNSNMELFTNIVDCYGNINMQGNNISNIGDLLDNTSNNKIDMNDGAFLNAINISSNGNGAIMQETTSTNNIGILSSGGGMAIANGSLQLRCADPAGSLNIVKQFSGDINLDSAGLVVVNNSDLSLNDNDIQKCININGLTAVGGKYSQFTPNIAVDGTDARTSLVNTASSVGSNVFDIDELKDGAVYHILVKGDIETDSKEDLQIRILLGAVVIFDTTLTQFADTGAAEYAFELEVDIFCKTAGVAGVFYTNGQILYIRNDNENSLRGKSSQTDSVIDTTIANTLDIDAVWSGASADEILTSKTITISKTY